MLVTIYYLKDPDTKEIKYIGRTKNNLKARLRGHLATAKRNKFKTKKDNWFLKLFRNNKRPIIESVLKVEGWEESYSKEQEVIKSHIDKGFNLVNLHDRGPGSLRTITLEQKKKISNTVKQLHKDGIYDSRGLKLTLYDLQGNRLKNFKNVRTTAEYIGVNMKHLETSLKRGDKKVHEFQVRKIDIDKIKPYPYMKKTPNKNSVNCLETPEEDNQQPSLSSNTLKGSTTSSESQEDNNSTTNAEQPIRLYQISNNCILIGDAAMETFDKAMRKKVEDIV